MRGRRVYTESCLDTILDRGRRRRGGGTAAGCAQGGGEGGGHYSFSPHTLASLVPGSTPLSPPTVKRGGWGRGGSSGAASADVHAVPQLRADVTSSPTCAHLQQPV